jgi:NDP-sugar pyrophosphorylase family protein
MQAAILAGGLGTRLRPLTHEVPKPMVPIAGKPYLEHQLVRLREQGIADIVLLTGYLAEQIEEHFGDGARHGLRIRYSREATPIGTGGALAQAADLLAPEFLLLYGDSFLPIHYPAVLEMLGQRGDFDLVLTAYDNRRGNTDVQNNLEINEAGRVLTYAKDTGNPRLNYVEAGVLAIRRQVVERMPEARPLSLEKTIFPELIARGALGAWITTERFYDFGTPERLAETQLYFAERA